MYIITLDMPIDRDWHYQTDEARLLAVLEALTTLGIVVKNIKVTP